MADAAPADAGIEDAAPEGEGGESGKKKGGGLAGLLPNLLKFIAIGLGAIILIVTVCIVTYTIMNKGGKNQTAVPTTEAYIATKQTYSFFTLLDEITTRTRDAAPWTVQVKVNIGYDENDNAAATEFTSRRYQMQDFLRNYFARKYHEELTPENEPRIKNEIKELLNTQVLGNARARIILFDKFDMMQM